MKKFITRTSHSHLRYLIFTTSPLLHLFVLIVLSSKWVEKKPPFFIFCKKRKKQKFAPFSRKMFVTGMVFAKNCSFQENFREKFSFLWNFRDFFCYGQCLCSYFCILEAFRQKWNLFKWSLGKIYQCFGPGYKFSWLLDPDTHSEQKIFGKTFAHTKILSDFSRKRQSLCNFL
jgi:hypothetical protein